MTCWAICPAASGAAPSTRASSKVSSTIDLEKFAGWKDWTFYANAFRDLQHRPHPARLRRRHEHDRRDRSDADRCGCRNCGSNAWAAPLVSDLASSQPTPNFSTAISAQMFLQSDWPTIAAVNLPGGGPAYPLSALGARIKYDFRKDASLLLCRFQRRSGRAVSGRRSRHLQPLRREFPSARSGLHDRRIAVPAQ